MIRIGLFLLLLKIMSDESQDQTQRPETVVFSGKIGEVINTEQPDGRMFERYRRPPGIRLIIISPEGKILITREHRDEAGGVDLRLPGGKVCDSLNEYHALLDSGKDIIEAAQAAAIKEALEETGLIIEQPELITKANAGATVEWNLYYFLVDKYTESPDGQELEPGEDIEVTWLSADELRQAIENDEMREWRSIGVLLAKVLPKL